MVLSDNCSRGVFQDILRSEEYVDWRGRYVQALLRMDEALASGV